MLLRGTALHAGGEVSVELSRSRGPIVWAQRGREVLLPDAVVARADRGVTLASHDGLVRIDLVEHLLAACAGLGIRDGIRIRTDDDELPLLDGGARSFAEALRAIDAPARPSPLRVAHEASFDAEGACYRFRPGPLAVRVEVEFPPPIGREDAAWHGDPEDFITRIAPARTFGWASEHAALLAAGRARAVDLASVIVLDAAGPIAACRPNAPGEIARHKLLDLLGDLGFYGGPPEGSIDAWRPGHAATHRIVADALRSGVLVARSER